VFVTGVDPVEVGLVASFNRPGANVTGVTFLSNKLVAKRLELLASLTPGATPIGMLAHTRNPNTEADVRDALATATALGRTLHVERVASASDLNTAVASLVQRRVAALFFAPQADFCVAGALWAYHTGFVSVEAFDFHMLIQFLAMVIIGGLGSVLGACLGAVFVVVLPHIISIAADKLPFLQGLGGKSFDLQVGVFGVVMLLFLIFEPRGLAGIWARVRFYFQLWPFKYRAWES